MYGQSLFETIVVSDGRACLLDLHLSRLEHGAARLGMAFSSSAARADIEFLALDQPKAVIRFTLSFGLGGRGYLNPASPKPTTIAGLYDYPEYPSANWQAGIRLGMVDLKLAHQAALAGLKHGNRLEQIIARSQWHDSWQEALVCDQDGHVIEGTQSNVFVIKNNMLLTPKLDFCGVAGVMREFIISQANKVGVDSSLVSLSVADINEADAVFLSNSVIGLWPVKQFYDREFADFSVAHKLLEIMIEDGAIPNI